MEIYFDKAVDSSFKGNPTWNGVRKYIGRLWLMWSLIVYSNEVSFTPRIKQGLGEF